MNKKNKITLLSFCILLFIITASITIYICDKKNPNFIHSNRRNVMIENDTISLMKTKNAFKEEYSAQYEKINANEREDFATLTNLFLEKNYTPEEINLIFAKLSDTNITKLKDLNYVNFKEYADVTNLEIDKISRYETYKETKNCSLEEAVTKVNIGLDHDFYTEIEKVNNPNEYTVLVNKYHSLENYAPNDLKSLSYDKSYKMRAKAADAFEELVSAGKLDSVYIRPYSAYRSFERQTVIYEQYVKRDGQNKADTYSARPGHSEHQTGLAVDVWSEGYQEIKPTDYSWLLENSYKYGFIIRYTKDNIGITGYIEEPWHLRYVGKDIAKDVVEKNLTYDEYYDLYLKNAS